MQRVHISQKVQSDGKLTLSNLPCHKGDYVEGDLLIRQSTGLEQHRAARQRFVERVRRSGFVSHHPYPSRDELHERH